jgi:hypothetical protein
MSCHVPCGGGQAHEYGALESAGIFRGLILRYIVVLCLATPASQLESAF